MLVPPPALWLTYGHQARDTTPCKRPLAHATVRTQVAKAALTTMPAILALPPVSSLRNIREPKSDVSRAVRGSFHQFCGVWHDSSAGFDACYILLTSHMHCHQITQVKLEYAEGVHGEYPRLARQLHVMDDEKVGVWRTAYGGVVSMWRGGVKYAQLLFEPSVVTLLGVTVWVHPPNYHAVLHLCCVWAEYSWYHAVLMGSTDTWHV